MITEEQGKEFALEAEKLFEEYELRHVCDYRAALREAIAVILKLQQRFQECQEKKGE